MQAQQNQSQGWQQISTDTVISDLSESNLIYDWSEYQIVRTILQEFMGAQSHVGYYFGEVLCGSYGASALTAYYRITI